jgi:DNA (cytosine-5)-methyltransferase 1
MSLGFEQAGFDVVAAFDIELHNVETYKKNFATGPAFQCDLSKAAGDQLRKKAKLGRKRIDVVFGGPPCQGFSEIGKRLLTDPRNQLLFHFSRLVRQLKPRYFVLENVEGLTLGDSQDLLDSFLLRVKRAGYDVVEPVQVLDAVDYGIPQRRHRLFVLGFERGLPPPSYPLPCPLRNSQGRIVEPKVIDAIRDLRKVVDRQDPSDSDVFLGRLGRPSYYAKLLRGEVLDPDDQSIPRKRNGDGLSGCLRTWHSDDVVERFSATIPGTSEPISRFYRLANDGVAPTLRAGTSVEHGSHTAARPIHPDQPRCITTREAARLHSFPDWFQFHSTRWHGFKQIGNSVPPRMARAVARSIIQAICGGNNSH